jgi:hypothetical protein
MCNFFSCIVTKAGEVLFTESESHEEVISRSGMKDNLRHFVRVEYTPKEGYIIDEANIPEWYERVAAKAEQNVVAIYIRIAPAWEEYEKVEQPALDEYKSAIANVQGYLKA